ncbi:Afadin and alpha-actinin-binding-domain-containing protein [Dipodascopsis tothii]|uniref:Afadin and alpha-actinin-binding-domain-containing protein n=1 Tax=Dipodascopsis tothii TaxID=44089 RepID=UPI0034CF6110
MDADTDTHYFEKFLNKTLVSKGLLREDQALDFHSGADVVPIINLVYELVKIRDQDAEQREKLTDRLVEYQNGQKDTKLQLKQLKQRIDGQAGKIRDLEAAANVAKTSLKTAEVEHQKLQAASTKQKQAMATLQQQDANERRKRDQQILRLKEKAGFDVRRAKPLPMLSGSMPFNGVDGSGGTAAEFFEDAGGTLPDVVVDLTAENDKLTALLRETLLALNIMNGSTRLKAMQLEEALKLIPSSYDDFSIEINNALGSLRERMESLRLGAFTEDVSKKDEQITELEKQLEATRQNWQTAMASLEDWNKYLEQRGGKRVDMSTTVGESLKEAEAAAVAARADTVCVKDPEPLYPEIAKPPAGRKILPMPTRRFGAAAADPANRPGPAQAAAAVAASSNASAASRFSSRLKTAGGAPQTTTTKVPLAATPKTPAPLKRQLSDSAETQPRVVREPPAQTAEEDSVDSAGDVTEVLDTQTPPDYKTPARNRDETETLSQTAYKRMYPDLSDVFKAQTTRKRAREDHTENMAPQTGSQLFDSVLQPPQADTAGTKGISPSKNITPRQSLVDATNGRSAKRMASSPLSLSPRLKMRAAEAPPSSRRYPLTPGANGPGKRPIATPRRPMATPGRKRPMEAPEAAQGPAGLGARYMSTGKRARKSIGTAKRLYEPDLNDNEHMSPIKLPKRFKLDQPGGGQG